MRGVAPNGGGVSLTEDVEELKRKYPGADE